MHNCFHTNAGFGSNGNSTRAGETRHNKLTPPAYWHPINTHRQLGGVWGALHQRVEKIYNNLTTEEQICVQRIFLRLVAIGGDEESGTECKAVRRRAMRFEFNDPLEQKVLTQLIDQNLLVSDRQPHSEVSTVEIAQAQDKPVLYKMDEILL